NEQYGEEADAGLLLVAGLGRSFVLTGAEENKPARQVCKDFIAMTEQLARGGDDSAMRNMLAVAKACWAFLWSEACNLCCFSSTTFLRDRGPSSNLRYSPW